MPRIRRRRYNVPLMAKREGWTGWDTYAPFYDWENARTLGRRDVPFWRSVALQTRGPVLELGCGTGRISLPLARAGVSVVGIDRSAPMLERAAKRLAAMRKRAGARGRRRLRLVRGDIRFLPFERAQFRTVLAPYGILQSLVRDKDLNATLDCGRRRSRTRRALRRRPRAGRAELARVLEPDPAERESRRRGAPDAGGVGAAGSQEAPDDLRADLHRAARHEA